MKRLVFLFAMILFSLIQVGYVVGCSVSGKGRPDLVVVAFEKTGAVTLDKENRAVVPVHVAVKNRGSSEAGVFKIAIMYTGVDGPRYTSFVVKGQKDPRYVQTRGILKPGSEFVFNGTVVFHPSEQAMIVPMYAVVDSCNGERDMPSYCRVDESNERNNQSDSISITLP